MNLDTAVSIPFKVVDGAARDPAIASAPERVRVMCAVVILIAIASAVLLLWLASGDGDGGYRGIELSCVHRLEDGGGDASICGRAQAGARVNVVGQLSLAVATGVLVVRRREPVMWIRAAVATSIALTFLCYVFMRSWEVGLGQKLL